MNITLNLAQTLALAAMVSYIGSLIKNRIKFFQTYFIPTPVIGGIIYALLMLIGYQTGSFFIELDNTLTPLLLVIFFTATGFTFSVKQLAKSGSLGLKLSIIVIVLMIIQNGIMPLVSPLLGIDPLLGLTVGSMSMTGGPGAAAAFAPTIEALGIDNASLSGVAAATAGLVIGSMVGGPVARYLIKKHNIETTTKQSLDDIDDSFGEAGDNAQNVSFTSSVLQVLFAVGAGTIVVWILDSITGFGWPTYVGGLFFAAIMRNITEPMGVRFDIQSIEMIGNASLNIFLTLTIMGLEVWKLLDLALPLIALLIIQTAILILLAIFVVFKFLGGDYDAAVMTAGVCGVGIGSTPNAVANMEAVTQENGPSPTSMLMLPIVVSVVISLLNSIIISVFINIL